MSWSLKLITIRGIPIRVHASFLLIVLWAAYIGLANSARGGCAGPCSWSSSCCCSSSAWYCMSWGTAWSRSSSECRCKTLPCGPSAGWRGWPRCRSSRTRSSLITAAGPAVNVLLALGLGRWHCSRWAPARWSRWSARRTGSAELLSGLNGRTLILLLAANNALLALFNLAPAFPMDGGRLLRSFLAAFLPFGTATRIASIVGQVLAVLHGRDRVLHRQFLPGHRGRLRLLSRPGRSGKGSRRAMTCTACACARRCSRSASACTRCKPSAMRYPNARVARKPRIWWWMGGSWWAS